MDGTFEREGEWVVLRFERRLGHPVERVWAALTEPEQLEKWLASTVIEPRPGGRLELTFTHSEGHDVGVGEVTEIEPPKVLEYTWYPQQLGDSRVRWSLTPEEDGCRLVLTHRFPASYGIVETLGGWHVHLEALAALLAGEPYDLKPRAQWRDAQRLYVERYGLTALPAAGGES